MWAEDLLFGLALDTAGTDPETARIATAAVVRVQAARQPIVRDWLVDLTDELLAEPDVLPRVDSGPKSRRSVVDTLLEIDGELTDARRDGFPVVVFNATFGLTVLDREFRRYGIDENGIGLIWPVIDPLVLDEACDRLHSGQRRLTDLCRHYRVSPETGHSFSTDALAAVRLATDIAERFPIVGAASPAELHAIQQRAHRTWVTADSTSVGLEWPKRSSPYTRVVTAV